jgi:hypothetical protein
LPEGHQQHADADGPLAFDAAEMQKILGLLPR